VSEYIATTIDKKCPKCSHLGVKYIQLLLAAELATDLRENLQRCQTGWINEEREGMVDK